MELSQLERYAPQARRDFIEAVTAKAAKLGISDAEIVEAKKSGEALIIAGKAFPAAIERERNILIDRVTNDGFDKVMEKAAYTWFNRFAAIRYMEVHGYIKEHDFSLFESGDGGSEPEIIKHVSDLSDWDELDFGLALDLKTQNKTEELYRLIIQAQRRSLSKIIPFLFSYRAVEIESLSPDGLLLSDSVMKKMAKVLSRENLEKVESLGWLYQFYISDRKDALMKAGKAYKTDEIPAVTQLFTPNWIVKYLTQNSIGRLWLSVHPSSPLKEKMEYYIEPAGQSDEVNRQLAEITPDSLEPEEITILDPACGSGHILVEAYNLLKEIYLERGHEEREIPKLILKNNLFGLDIDDRAAQLARFALLMRARKDDKRLFRAKGEIELNVYSIQETNDLNIGDFKEPGIDGLEELFSTFKDARTFGSLIEIPESLNKKLESISAELLEIINAEQQSIDSGKASRLMPLVNQAKVMARKYDAVVANPPYLGSGKLTPILKDFVKKKFPGSKSDLFAVFIENGFNYAKETGYNALITMQSWMFLSSFQKIREAILREKSIITMAHLGARAFGSISGEVVQTTAFVVQNKRVKNYNPAFFRLIEGNEESKRNALKRGENRFDQTMQDDFKKIPGSPIAYWVSGKVRNVFDTSPQIREKALPKQGSTIGNNEHFLRMWFELSFPYNEKWKKTIKGGSFRRWYGNLLYVVNWGDNGECIKSTGKATIRNKDFLFKQGTEWSRISSAITSFRILEKGFFHESASIA